MRYGLISDIHANLEALEAVLSELEKAKVDDILCLGDLIGYGPDPDKCVELVRTNTKYTIAGNHDHAILGLIDTRFFNDFAKKSVEWTKVQLSQTSLEFLHTLPLVAKEENFTLVHASPARPEAWNYILSVDDASDNFNYIQGICCFVGHSHVPIILEKNYDETVSVIRKFELELQKDKQYIINIGSVGQPRDLDPRAAYAIFDTSVCEFELKRVRYDMSKTQKKIIERGLPVYLAERLSTGQ
ncbi:MAG: metallophosphoesterase family protein [Deferribacteres bacterium]|nr:metallophosphoesterase family protein [candidate division KSB1 bacterium]MCB9504066.1 metallophosphoesterase family protein [Deferribacteres bacterium]